MDGIRLPPLTPRMKRGLLESPHLRPPCRGRASPGCLHTSARPGVYPSLGRSPLSVCAVCLDALQAGTERNSLWWRTFRNLPLKRRKPAPQNHRRLILKYKNYIVIMAMHYIRLCCIIMTLCISPSAKHSNVSIVNSKGHRALLRS
jgi:hypothetical protein